MAMNPRRTIVATFDDPADADRAIDALQNAGFSANQIHHVGRVNSASTGTGGFWDSVKSFFTGDDMSTSSDATDDFSSWGLSQDEVNYYENEHRTGRSVVAVNASGREQEAESILRSSGGYNYAMRAGATGGMTSTATAADTDYGQSSGLNRMDQNVTSATETPVYDRADTYDTSTTGMNRMDDSVMSATQTPNYNAANQTVDTTQPTDYADTDMNRSMKLREEQLQATKERVQSGEVRLHKDVVEEQKTMDVPVTHEEVYVERRDVPTGQVDNTPITEGESIRVPVSEEQVNVTKTPVVTGEVSVGKRAVQDTQQVSDTVKREEARVVQQGNPNVQGADDMLTSDTTTDTYGTTDNPRNSL